MYLHWPNPSVQYIYENHLSIVTVVGVARSTGVKVTHVLLQGPYVLCVCVLDRLERERERETDLLNLLNT